MCSTIWRTELGLCTSTRNANKDLLFSFGVAKSPGARDWDSGEACLEKL